MSRHKIITQIDLNIYNFIYAYIEKNKGLFPTTREIHAATKHSTSMISNTFRKFIEFGFLERMPGITGVARTWRLIGTRVFMPPVMPLVIG